MFSKYIARFETPSTQAHFSTYFQTSFIRFSVKEQTFFIKRLSFLIKAGVPMLESLHLIANQTKSKAKKKIFDAIIADVTSGQTLAGSMMKFKHQFGVFTIHLIAVGEHSGILSENLLYLANELTKKHALQRKVRGALVYPLFITATTLGITGLLTVFIFPKIMPVFASLDITLPLTTRILLAVSVFLVAWGWYMLLCLCVCMCAFLFLRTRIVWLHQSTDRILLSLPIAGAIARSYNISNFCRTLGLLLRAGIPVSEALSITAHATENLVYKEIYEHMATEVTKGKTIASSAPNHFALFPDLLIHMITIGETSGSLTDTLHYLAELYETEVDEKTKNLSSTVEPILLVVMGMIVGLIAVSVITPIYDITRNLQR